MKIICIGRNYRKHIEKKLNWHLFPNKYVNEKQFESSKLLAAGLRFYTVYGEYGRPDMALGLFAEAMAQGKPI